MGKRGGVAVRAIAIAILGACGGGGHGADSVAQSPAVAATSFPTAAPFVTPGERMTYRLALGGVDLATFDLAVGDVEEIAGRRTVVVQGHAKATGLVQVVAHIDDTFTSWIDVETGRPLRYFVDEFAYKGSDKERSDARMYERRGDLLPIHFHLNDEPPTPERQRVSMRDVWDYNAFVVALRGWEAPPGTTVRAEVLRSRYLWNVEMTIRRRETLVTALGAFPALRFEGRAFKLERDGSRDRTAEERNVTLWISDDADRVPLQTNARTDYGDIEMTIVDYTPGTGPRLRP